MSDLVKSEWWHYPAPTYRQLDDSERNQMAELAHEGCEGHCDECGGCIYYGERPHIDSVGDEVCEDCCDVCYDAATAKDGTTLPCSGAEPRDGEPREPS